MQENKVSKVKEFVNIKNLSFIENSTVRYRYRTDIARFHDIEIARRCIENQSDKLRHLIRYFYLNMFGSA